jgi:deazaflavin-dependent oxidoreductase (nitroreductase family)
MPLSHTIARTNRYWINPVARTIGPRIPPFMLVHHTGRKSGREFTTPVWAFRRPGGFIIVLTYGPRTDWLRNLLAAGSCSATYANQTWRLTNPEVRHGDPNDQPLPWFVRAAVKAIGVDDFLYVSATPNWSSTSGACNRSAHT